MAVEVARWPRMHSAGNVLVAGLPPSAPRNALIPGQRETGMGTFTHGSFHLIITWKMRKQRRRGATCLLSGRKGSWERAVW